MVVLPTLLPEMEHSKTIHALPKTVTVESLSLEEEGQGPVKRWPPIARAVGGQRGPAAGGLSVVGNQRASVSRAFTSKCTTRSLQRTGSAGSVADSATGTERSHALEEENQRLREELARYQTDAMAVRRRPMAAIAGGGFRGAGPQKPCMCEDLKAKLARCQAALQAARKRSMTVAFDMVDYGEQSPLRHKTAEPGAPASQAEASEESSSGEEEKVPPPPPCSPCGLPPVPGTDEARSSVSTEASLPATFLPTFADAQVQAEPSRNTSSVQAVTSIVTMAAEVQTKAEPDVASSSAQTEAPEVASVAAEVQTEAERPLPLLSSETQTEAEAALAMQADTQTEAAQVPEMLHAQTQTQAEVHPPKSEAEVQTQADCAPTMKAEATQTEAAACCESSSQTTPSALSAVAVQTTPAKGVSCGTQAERPKVGHQAVQAEDSTAQDALARVKQLEAASLAEADQLQAWRDMATAKALGKLNVTILCPRAECTVNGVKVEMDSWRSELLRRDFEEKVLPRFVQLIVSDVQEQSSNTDLVKSMMEELGSIFRERLAALLSAPNAAAAMAAAKAAKAA